MFNDKQPDLTLGDLALSLLRGAIQALTGKISPPGGNFLGAPRSGSLNSDVDYKNASRF